VGKEMEEAHERAAKHAVRALLVDPTVGAEVFDAHPNLVVTLADYDHRTRTRITLFGRRPQAGPTPEEAAAVRGAERTFEGLSRACGELVYRATHRAIPDVTRELWRVSRLPGVGETVGVDAEKLGHLGVAVFVAPDRARIVHDVSGDLAWALEPWPVGTLLLSMDQLQRWTWTRRSGRRGDFLALVPVPGAKTVRVVAIESKGSADQFYDGCEQARIARDKLKERFDGPGRWRERGELAAIAAAEAFRATRLRDSRPEALYGVLANLAHDDTDLRFHAICVSTARTPDKPGLTLREQSGVLWTRIGGTSGIASLT
jgi:hypothetical protein